MRTVTVKPTWLKACGMSSLAGKPLEVEAVSERACGMGRAFTVRVPGRKGPWTVMEARLSHDSLRDGPASLER